MRELKNQLNKNLHHAYVLEGDKDLVLEFMRDFLEKEIGVTLSRNPDLFEFHFETLGIDDARELYHLQSNKSLSLDGKQFFLISAFGITTEAQNALLKLLEEPTESTHFFFILPYIGMLIPTLRSRVFVIQTRSEDINDHVSSRDFLKKSIPERMKLLKGTIEDKDKKEALRFLNELEETLHTNYTAQMTKEAKDALEEILVSKEYLARRAPSVKMILEYISVITPRMEF